MFYLIDLIAHYTWSIVTWQLA